MGRDRRIQRVGSPHVGLHLCGMETTGRGDRRDLPGVACTHGSRHAGRLPPAAALVDAHRAQITKLFYDCTPEIHAGLGAMYVADERFRSNINKSRDGLAEYLSTAIEARYTD